MTSTSIASTRRAFLMALLGAAAQLYAPPLHAADRGASKSARSTGFSQADTRRVDRLLQLIQQRLDQAPAAAESRWKSMIRIEDSFGEQMAIDAARTQSARLGFDPETGARFAEAQIEAGKAIQAARHRQWTQERSSAPVRESDTSTGAKPSVVAFQTPPPEPPLEVPLLIALRDAAPVLKRAGGRRLLDARAADLIQLGGADLLASQIALKPLYDLSN